MWGGSLGCEQTSRIGWKILWKLMERYSVNGAGGTSPPPRNADTACMGGRGEEKITNV